MGIALRSCLLLGAALSATYAQTVGASLQGTVTDPSGAVIACANVEILNVDTGAARRLVSDDAGRWREPVLGPGEYQIKAAASGFQTLIRKGIHLAVGQEATVDLRLEVGR